MSDTPKINQQFQDLHSSTPTGIDWVTIQSVEKDICLLYHQLANYSYIMGDLWYGDVFNMPYWDFLDIEIESDEEKAEFIKTGCLVMLYAMCSELLDGTGFYLTADKNRFHLAKESIGKAKANQADVIKLLEIVQSAFELINTDQLDYQSKKFQKVERASEWIHKTFVRAYFEQRVHDFENHPYFTGKGAV